MHRFLQAIGSRTAVWLAEFSACATLIIVSPNAANATSVYDAAILAQSPVAYWTLDDASKANGQTALSSNATYNGTYTGGVTNASPGAAQIGGSAAVFSGGNTSSSPNIPFTDTGLPSGNGSRTLIAWINTSLTPTSGSGFNIFGYGTPGTTTPLANTGQMFMLYVDQNGKANATDFGASALSSVTVNDGNWHMIAATVDSGVLTGGQPTWKVYSDVSGVMTAGTAVGQLTNTVLGGSQHSIAGNLTYTSGSTQAFNGKLDEVALFSSVLTQSQLQTIFNAAQVPEPTSIALLASGVVGVLLVRLFRRSRGS